LRRARRLLSCASARTSLDTRQTMGARTSLLRDRRGLHAFRAFRSTILLAYPSRTALDDGYATGARKPPCYLRRGRAVVWFASPEKVRGSGAPKGALVENRVQRHTAASLAIGTPRLPALHCGHSARAIAPPQFRAALPGTWTTSSCPSPASSSQSGHSAARAGSRNRPGTSLRSSCAGSRTGGRFLPSHRS
jgi:hypothetical protein